MSKGPSITETDADLEAALSAGALQARIVKLEEALNAVTQWSLDKGIDLTSAGFENWCDLLPHCSYSEAEMTLLRISPPRHVKGYRLSPAVGLQLRGTLDLCAGVIQVLSLSFHPQRGENPLRRDIERAKRLVSQAFQCLRSAEAALDD
jgi:hypothetical protein